MREREREGERVTIRSLFYLLFQRASNIKKKKEKKNRITPMDVSPNFISYQPTPRFVSSFHSLHVKSDSKNILFL